VNHHRQVDGLLATLYANRRRLISHKIHPLGQPVHRRSNSLSVYADYLIASLESCARSYSLVTDIGNHHVAVFIREIYAIGSQSEQHMVAKIKISYEADGRKDHDTPGIPRGIHLSGGGIIGSLLLWFHSPRHGSLQFSDAAKRQSLGHTVNELRTSQLLVSLDVSAAPKVADLVMLRGIAGSKKLEGS
jgi:hypothetical protein